MLLLAARSFPAVIPNHWLPIRFPDAWYDWQIPAAIDTVVNLPASLNGQTVHFRWLMGSTTELGSFGAWVDDVRFGARVCQSCNLQLRVIFNGAGDFNWRRQTDYAVRPSTGTWFYSTERERRRAEPSRIKLQTRRLRRRRQKITRRLSRRVCIGSELGQHRAR